MKFTKTAAATTVALGALATVLAYSSTTKAVAQTPATAQTPASVSGAAAAPATTPAADPAKAATPPPVADTSRPDVPRHAGTFSGSKVDAMTYTPTCPVFSIGLDAAAIQESNSRSFVEAEAARFETVRDRWDAHEDCLVENGRRDTDIIRDRLGATLSMASTSEATAFNALNAAAIANNDRISKMPAPKAPKAVRGAPAPAAAAPATLSTWTAPTGRFVGTLTGTTLEPIYTSGCPVALGTITAAAFNSAPTREAYLAVLDELRVIPDRINQVRPCRQENGQDDYEALQKAVTDGVNAAFGPRKVAFEREYAAVRFQLNEHRNPGGLLAPPEMGRAKAKAPAVKTKAKKKK